MKGFKTLFTINPWASDEAGVVRMARAVNGDGSWLYGIVTVADRESRRDQGRISEPVGFANSGGLVFVDESAEEVAAA